MRFGCTVSYWVMFGHWRMWLPLYGSGILQAGLPSYLFTMVTAKILSRGCVHVCVVQASGVLLIPVALSTYALQ
jgi:hypothetical protein